MILKSIISKVLSSYLLYESNHALRVFTIAPKLQFKILNPRPKIIRNVNFSPVGQNNNLSLKLNSTRQQESKVCSVLKQSPGCQNIELLHKSRQ